MSPELSDSFASYAQIRGDRKLTVRLGDSPVVTSGRTFCHTYKLDTRAAFVRQ